MRVSTFKISHMYYICVYSVTHEILRRKKDEMKVEKNKKKPKTTFSHSVQLFRYIFFALYTFKIQRIGQKYFKKKEKYSNNNNLANTFSL